MKNSGMQLAMFNEAESVSAAPYHRNLPKSHHIPTICTLLYAILIEMEMLAYSYVLQARKCLCYTQTPVEFVKCRLISVASRRLYLTQTRCHGCADPWPGCPIC